MLAAFLILAGCAAPRKETKTAALGKSAPPRTQKLIQQSKNGIFDQSERFISEHSVQIIIRCEYETDDKKVISTDIVNGFMAEPGILISVGHAFEETEGKKCAIVARTSAGGATAKLVLRDGSNDIAILETELRAESLQVRGVAEKESVLYVLGVMPLRKDDEIQGAQFLHKSFLWPDPSVVKENLLPLLGSFNLGMSGSPVVGRDGKVVGIFSVIFGQTPFSSAGGAIKAKYIQANLRFYHKQIKKDRPNSKKQ
jgi:hypothetical protein